MSKLYFVSSNSGKIAEAQKILGFPIEIAKLELPEIQDLDIEKIVRVKAQAAFDHLHQPLFVDDVGLYVNAWNGFPGPFIKFLREAGGNELLLHMLKHERNRTVVTKATIGFHDGKKIHTFIGEIVGDITHEPRIKRDNSWGWEPIFQPQGRAETFAEMSEEEKNAISHRRLALEKLKAYLTDNNISFA